MQISKKAWVSCISFTVILILLSAIIFEPMIQFGGYYYCDGKYREQTAGQYTLLFMGDSDGMASFNPNVFLEETGIQSYNLAGVKNTSESEYYLLEQELKRNPVDDVILQVGIETFTRDYELEHGDGNTATAMRITNVFERIRFLAKTTSLDGWLDTYSQMLTYGILCWGRNLTGNKESNYNGNLKGWHKLNSNDRSITKEQAQKSFNLESINSRFRDDRVNEFENIINLCKEYGVNVTVIMVPMAGSYLWKISNCDEIRDKIDEICVDNEVEFVDFNLYKRRYDLFKDDSSFKDSIHTSEEGAEQFTKILAEVYEKLKQNKPIDDLFYESYEIMKEDSPYMEYLH